MGMKARNRYFIIWCSNRTDCQDDEPIKIKAKNRTEALKEAKSYVSSRFFIDQAYTLSEFREFDPWWASVFHGQKALNE